MSLKAQNEFMRVAGLLRPLVKRAIELRNLIFADFARDPANSPRVFLLELAAVVPELRKADKAVIGTPFGPSGRSLLQFFEEFLFQLEKICSGDHSEILPEYAFRCHENSRVNDSTALKVREIAVRIRSIVLSWEHRFLKSLFGPWASEFYFYGSHYFPPGLFEHPAHFIASSGCQSDGTRRRARRKTCEERDREWQELHEQGLSHEQIRRMHNAQHPDAQISNAAVRKALKRRESSNSDNR